MNARTTHPRGASHAAPPVVASGRIRLLAVGMIVAIGYLVWRMFVWQILEFHKVLEYLPLQTPPEEQARNARGAILDRNGLPMAMDVWTYRVFASPFYMGDEANRRRVAEELAVLLKRPVENIWKKLSDKSVKYTVIEPRTTLTVGDTIRARRLDGIGVDRVPVRQYPAATLASQSIGFVNARNEGLYGVEEQYDQYLKGNDEGCRTPADKALPRVPVGSREFQPSANACDLVLTLDWAIQDVVERELLAAVERTRATSGTIVVLEPTTGRILAMASLPTYDVNKYYETSVSLFRNPAVSLDYEPGSVAKIMTMAAGLDSGQFAPSTTMVDTGEIWVGGRSIMNWDKRAHGRVNMTDCLAKSLNVCSAYISTSIGPARFYEYADRFGFGKLTGVDIANEATGSIRRPGVPTWSLSDLGTNSFGQGMSTTPLQIALMASAIANDGVMMKPYIVEAIVRNGEVVRNQPVPLRRVVSGDTARTLAGMLSEAIERESIPATLPDLRVAGKTGTASIPDPRTLAYDTKNTIASFVGWAPVDQPRFVMLVKLDKPQTSDFGSQVAAPVFREIARKLMILLDINVKLVSR